MKAFEEKVSAQLQEAKAKIDEIEAQVKGKLAQAEIDAIKFFKTTRQEIDKKRQDLRASSETRAAQLKAEIEADVAKLKTSLEQFSTKVSGPDIRDGTLRFRDPPNSVQMELRLAEEIRPGTSFPGIVGQSSALRDVLQLVEMVAPRDSTVLLLGETGTGKELIARAIHNRSHRKSGRFVELNCAAIPRGLLESELFGHERGAFTGAIVRKTGRLELADHGSLFLDEIGDIPLELQPKLLRVLQEREFERLGSTQTKKADVRVVAATHRDLEEMIREKQFRSDLYYRMNVFPISIPPLRERPEDIPLLVRHFVQQFAQSMNKTIDAISCETMEALTRYPWPGNIRELQNVIERSVIVHEKGKLSVKKSWFSREYFHTEPVTQPAFRRSALQDREIIGAALAETRGRVSGPSGAAAKLGIPPSTLESKIRSMHINKYSFKASA
jgi:formate hydrogenlyase transcriptional activator